MFLHLEVSMISFLVLLQSLYLFLVSFIVTDSADFRFDICASFECLPLFFPVTAQHLVQPFVVLSLRRHLSLRGGPLSICLLLDVHKHLLSSVE